MPLKPQTSVQRPASLLSSDDPFSGPWGNMVATGQTTLTVRFWKTSSEGQQEHHSYPYRMLSHWCWKIGDKETLEIHVPGGVVTVLGHGLDKLAEALDEGRLRTAIALKQGSQPVGKGDISISSIVIN